MYNIVIADDERLELMVLRQVLEDHLSDRCVVRAATNGREAVESALLSEADLAILDIDMPGMNGLEAAQIIAQKLPDCKIIMLTAYSEFEYARTAIALGTADYLLKPCTDQALCSALDKVLHQIDCRRDGEAEKERSIERIHSLSLQVEEQIVRTIMGGHITPEYMTAQMENYGVAFNNGVFAVLHGASANSDKDIVSALHRNTWPAHIHLFAYCYDGKVYIINVSDHSEVDAQAATLTHLPIISQAAKTLWGYPIFAAVGKSFSNIQYAQLSCFQAQVALGRCTAENPINIHEDGGETESAEFSDNPIINSILFGDIEEIGRAASGFVRSLFAQQLEWETIIIRLNVHLAKTVQSLKQQTGLSIPDVVIPTAMEQTDIESLSHTVTSRLCYLADQLLALGTEKDTVHLRKVKNEIQQYVAQHYHEDIFLPGIAWAMNYSSAYFSKLFKQCFQRNFITYLTDVRIQAAKELMQNSDITIREIGERVGYKDPNYFTKVFRRAVGICPSEYRERECLPGDM
ncbi:response regulator [Oscillospiraceae bacterium MB08-C2-2]|nr:response regulator [Oscillospiraceae bacterium MB08-C2-2]